MSRMENLSFSPSSIGNQFPIGVSTISSELIIGRDESLYYDGIDCNGKTSWSTDGIVIRI